MDEPKFTKGPWKVLNNLSYSDRKHHYQILTKDAGLWVANTEDCDNEEEEANAALIASAPELYDMLQKILDEHVIPTYKAQMAQEVIRILKKARGEE